MNELTFSRTSSIASALALFFFAPGCGSSSATPNNATGTPAAGVSALPSGGTVATPSGSAGTGPAVGGRAGATPGSAGTTPAGTSGTSAAGTSASVAGASAGAAGATSGAAGSGMSGPADLGEYFVSGAWRGYVWTSVQGMGSTIMPMDFKAQTTGMPRCVKGSVAATTDYSGTAQIGFNLNQVGSNEMTVTPTKAGVMIAITNPASSPLRFQVAAGTGASQKRWCASLTGSGGFIPWSSLNTMCWDGTGEAYNNEPINSAMVLVPGTMMAAVPFDFCVNSLAEADAPAGGAAGTGAAAGSGAAGMSGGPAAGSGAAGSGGPTRYPPVQGGCEGWATRYWDCCKPHCGWSSNSPAGPLAVCDRQDNSLGGNVDAANSCEGGPAFLCHNLSPWSVDGQLSFGYAAVAGRGDICGKCYQLEFAGRSRNAGNDPGSAALAGKTMIVQAINIGGDVGSNQFDIAVPGGGVGAFNACSSQWGVPASELGQTYGGFLATCKQQGNASDHSALKSCVMQKCTSVFESRGLTELFEGCKWFVDWFQAADNPALRYAEVACPSELTNRGVRRSGASAGACLR